MTDIIAHSLPFIIALVPKMMAAALLVVTATVVSEKMGPAIGALIATLPVSSGPAYVFLALDHGPAFISQSALSSLALNVPTAILAVIYVWLAQRRSLRTSIGLALAIWLPCVALSAWLDMGTAAAAILTVIVFPLCIFFVQPYLGPAAASGDLRISDVAIRASAVALLVAAVEAIGLYAGSEMTGFLAAFPIVFISMMVILHLRHGGPVAAAVLAHSIAGLAGVSAAYLALHFLAVPLGNTLALAVALCVSLLWNLGLFTMHRLRHSASRQAVTPSISTIS